MTASAAGPQATASADEIIARLALIPHPEGGHYRETFRDARHDSDGRAVSTAIYFLLRAGEVSRWHRIDAAEIWHWYLGDSLELSIWTGVQDHPVQRCRLGPDVLGGEAPQIVVPAAYWQSARTLGNCTLAGCTVAPGFTFETFELGADDIASDGPASRSGS